MKDQPKTFAPLPTNDVMDTPTPLVEPKAEQVELVEKDKGKPVEALSTLVSELRNAIQVGRETRSPGPPASDGTRQKG